MRNVPVNRGVKARDKDVLDMETDSLEMLYPKFKCPKCGDWFHMPWKFCECEREQKARESKIRRLIRKALARVFNT